ncbi:MAG TPA: hypothetical protein DCX89_02090 [Saprospirales bacterium]|nr:hypothetical protein [Saprospirales bacterium]HRQ29471.1 HYR domain-containing protein [Saprospiraceae bacterium]
MRKITKNLRFLFHTLLVGLLVLFYNQGEMIAQINTVTIQVDPPRYYSGGVAEMDYTVTFGNIMLERADFIEFVAPAGVTLTDNSAEPSIFLGCGYNSGQPMPANSGDNGIGWGHPVFTDGNSGCGVFEANIPHTFRLKVQASAAVTGNILIFVRVYGDNGSIASATLGLTNAACSLSAPNDVITTADNAACEAYVSFLGFQSGACGNVTIDHSGYYPVGTTEVVFIAAEGTVNEIRATRYVTVIDNQAPVITNCSNRVVNLSSGECATEVDFNFLINENCGDLERNLQQHLLDTVDKTVNCATGPTHYFRVFDLDALGIDNDFQLSSIDLGVYFASNGAQITVNIYELNGPFNPANLNLISNSSHLLPGSSQQIVNFAHPALIRGRSTFVVEVIAPVFGGIQGNVRVGFNEAGETAPTYIMGSVCGTSTPELVENAFDGTQTGNLVLTLHGYESAIGFSALHPSGLLPGDIFERGQYDLTYMVTDATGNSSTCSFTLTVVSQTGSTTALACNDTIQVSLDDECLVLVTPDMVLEGDHYGCADDYQVIVYDQFGNAIGDVINADYANQLLYTEVYDLITGNHCSSIINLEDKYPPVFICDPVITSCSGELLPGSDVPDNLAFNYKPSLNTIPANQTGITEFVIPIDGLGEAVITDLDVFLDIEHTGVTELTARLIHPDGTSIVLFAKPGDNVSCTTPNIRLTVKDDALLSSTDLDNACETTAPGISGDYQPVQSLANFNGKSIKGDWILAITDDAIGNGGKLNKVSLIFTQTGAILNLPIPVTASFEYNGSNTFTAYGFDACGPVHMTYEDVEFDQDCNSMFSKLIQRHWTAVDLFGNTSTCTQLVQVVNNGAAFLEFPPDYDNISLPAYSCDLGQEFYPHPIYAGFPTGDFCPDIDVYYEDIVLNDCPGTFKVLRQWRVTDWCTGSVIEHIQQIKVLDNEAPVIVKTIPDIVAYTDPFDCTADVDLPDPFAYGMIIYDCRFEEITYAVEYKYADANGNIPDDGLPWNRDGNLVKVNTPNGGFYYRFLNAATTPVWIKYIFTDPCGNSSELYFKVIVQDESKPIAVCDLRTQVVLGPSGELYADAFTFDDGSHDNCGELTYEARRMNAACGFNTNFNDRVFFCCLDVGTIQMVEMKVTDESGLFNVCMVEVEVIDKYPPILICPDVVVIECREDYNDLELTGTAEALDNCRVSNLTHTNTNVDISSCGVGTVTRQWKATDHLGLTSICYQTIHIINTDEFDGTKINWPADITIDACISDITPDKTGNVFVDDDYCSQVAITYKDQVFDVVQDACTKILRKWSVLDWCTFDQSNPYTTGYWEHTQIIKIFDNVAPVFDQSCSNQDFCTYDHCEGNIEFIRTATDDCTPTNQLRWIHRIDLFNDGNFDYADRYSNNASGKYPNGTHRIVWIVEDGCGNINTCEQLFTLKDCKKPTPLCYSVLATVVMDISGMVEICAESFDLCNCHSGSYDNCTAQEDLIFSFSTNVKDTCRILDCNDIPNGQSALIEMQIWVTDEAGNQDYCTVTLDLQDNEADACQDIDAGSIVLSGMIMNPQSQPLPGVEVEVSNNNSNIGFPKFSYTNEAGRFSMNGLYASHSYVIEPSDNSDITNGVTTLDLIYIQKHILGILGLESAYQIIAADADNNQKVSANDIYSIRNVILGKTDEYPNDQQSWRFIAAAAEIPNPANPFPFVEHVSTKNLKEYKNINFTGVKIGDVNNSSTTKLNDPAIETRSKHQMNILVDDRFVLPGDQMVIDFYAEDLTNVIGNQFTIEFDKDILSFVSLEGVGQMINEQNFGLDLSGFGLITVSWNTNEAPVLQNNKLFSLRFNSISSGELSKLIRLTDRITKAEAYSSELEVMDIDLKFRNGDSFTNELKYTLHQNIPNPFGDKTQIHFELPEDAEASIQFYDVTGKVLKTIKGSYKKGLNAIEITKNELGITGIIYYKLETGVFTQTRKMISIN